MKRNDFAFKYIYIVKCRITMKRHAFEFKYSKMLASVFFCSATYLISHMKGPGKCVRLCRESEYTILPFGNTQI